MCLIVFAWQSHPDFPLIVAANRDEFLGRPAAPAHWWTDAPDLLAGREPEVADVATLLARIREHARLAKELSTEKVALLKMRTIVPSIDRIVALAEASRALTAMQRGELRGQAVICP